jgi:arylsulfatase A-like enzyme
MVMNRRPEKMISTLEQLPAWADFGENSDTMGDIYTVSAAQQRLGNLPLAPAFTAIGIFRPHLPHYAPPENFSRYPREKVKLPPNPAGDFNDIPGPGEIMAHREYFRLEASLEKPSGAQGSLEHHIQSYQASSDFADEMVGRILDALTASGRAENTIIVLWADHGYHLGDKESICKFTLWEKSNHVPFIIVAPGVTRPGSRCDTPVSLINIYPTLVELAGLPEKEGLDGISLVPLLKDPETEWPHPAITTMGRGNHAVRKEQWRYIRYHDGSEELYDVLKDPWNIDNLIGMPAYDEVAGQLSKYLPAREVPVPGLYEERFYRAPGPGSGNQE